MNGMMPRPRRHTIKKTTGFMSFFHRNDTRVERLTITDKHGNEINVTRYNGGDYTVNQGGETGSHTVVPASDIDRYMRSIGDG